MDEPIAQSSADAPVSSEAGTRPRHFASAPTLGVVPTGDPPPPRRRRWVLPVLLAPVVLVVAVVVAWAVDTSSGVLRNVRLAGVDIGGLSEAELAPRLRELAEEFGATPVEIVVGDRSYGSTASVLGLMVDQDRTADAALEVGNEGFVLLRPLRWLTSFVSPRDTTLHLQVDGEQLAEALVELEGNARTEPTEPRLELVEGSFTVVPGVPGIGLDPEEVADRLLEAASAADFGDPIRIETEQRPIEPMGSEEEARAAAAAAEALVDAPIEVRTAAGSRTIEPGELRTWVMLSTQPDGSVAVTLDPVEVLGGLRAHFEGIEGGPVDATFTLEGGVPVVVPDRPGLVCCSDEAPAQLLAALEAGASSVDLELVEGRASFTTEDAQGWGITQAVGGNHAWRDGAPTTAGPGFTTYYAAGGARVINIHRIADLVRGAVIPPGGTFSVNDHVGRRTPEKGFVPAGAIRNGEHVDEVGGGVSQFATTLFNAAYFAGLDIVEYQAHSEYFSRYPRGREATMGYPSPDLVIHNDTPYGVLIWTSYTNTSLTVTLYSTPYATAEQTGIREAPSGSCTVVTTTRTRTFPDGRTEQDTFRARYRPGPGQGC